MKGRMKQLSEQLWEVVWSSYERSYGAAIRGDMEQL